SDELLGRRIALKDQTAGSREDPGSAVRTAFAPPGGLLSDRVPRDQLREGLGRPCEMLVAGLVVKICGTKPVDPEPIDADLRVGCGSERSARVAGGEIDQPRLRAERPWVPVVPAARPRRDDHRL